MRVSTPLRLTTATIAPISFAVASLTLLTSNNWSLWGVEALPAKTPATVSFGDLANITATADCLANQVPIDACDPYGRPFQPYVELPAQVLNFLGLGTSDTQVLGIALAAIFFVAITLTSLTVALHWKRSPPPLVIGQLLLALIAISPASMLAVERGQIEQLTLALVITALMAFASTARPLIRYSGTVTSLLATATKYLSIGMFLPFIHREMFTKRNMPALLAILVSAEFVLISLPNVLLATETSGASNPQTTKSAFAVTTLLASLFSGENISYGPTAEVVENWNTITIASYTLFVLTVAIWSLALSREKVRELSREHRTSPTSIAWLFTLGGGGVLLFPYLLGNSHDYRLIFLIPLVAGALLLTSSKPISGAILAISAALAAMTSAAMVPLPNGFIWNTPALVIGDAALMITLAGIAALWLTTAFTQESTSKS